MGAPSTVNDLVFLGGHPVGAFALGDVDPYAKLLADVAAMRTDSASATRTFTAGDYAKALAQYKAVAQRGADMVGPEIDNVGPPELTQPFTHDAWYVNGQIALLVADPPSALVASAAQAHILLDRMISDYSQAISASQRANQPATATTRSVLPYILIPAGIVILVKVGHMLLMRR